MSRLLSLAHAASREPALWLGLTCAAAAAVVGALLGFAGPIVTLAVLGALAISLWALTSLEVGLWGVIAVITLIPFGALPFKVVFTPSFLDLALLAAVTVYGFQWMTGQRRQLAMTPAHAPIAAFGVLALFSFVLGLPNGPLTSNLLRQFAEMLLSIAFAFVVVDYVDHRARLGRVIRVIILGGAGAALLGIVLYFLPQDISERLLSALGVFNYPAGGVLRFIEDNPVLAQRAISTSVDPNVLGGLLAMVGGLLAPQLFARRPLLGSRWLTYLAFGGVLLCLILTFSRGAIAALGVALAVLALIPRHRGLLVLIAVGVIALLVLPVTRDYVIPFVEGLRGQDLATQMRFGEYKDAFILIGRYPLLGVGFSGAPEIDIYLGVSSAYLILTEEMGLVGLAVFLVSVLVVFGWGLQHWRRVAQDDELAPLWLGAHMGVLAALGVGVVDHYFFNLAFHPAETLFWLFVGLCLGATRLSVRLTAPAAP
jgi:O-antigen ligase